MTTHSSTQHSQTNLSISILPLIYPAIHPTSPPSAPPVVHLSGHLQRGATYHTDVAPPEPLPCARFVAYVATTGEQYGRVATAELGQADGAVGHPSAQHGQLELDLALCVDAP
jgi:hypothetical protein